MANTSVVTINPANGQKLAEYAWHSDQDVARALTLAHESFVSWSSQTVEKRAAFLEALGATLQKQKTALARLISLEMGKVLPEAVAEIDKSARTCDYYHEFGPQMLRDTPLPVELGKAYVTYRGLGVVLGIMPWNFPVWQVIRFAVPTLLAGNSVILKHAPNVTGMALELEKILVKAGFPKGVFQTLVVDVPATEKLIAAHEVRGVSLTGSTRAGRRVGQIAGHHLKPCVLELGGNDPYLVLKDADLEVAAKTLVKARMLNAGQSCVAAKRWIVVEDVFSEFCENVIELVRNIKVGDPMTSTSQMGPIARQDLRDQLKTQVDESLRQGAKPLYSSPEVPSEGFFYGPRVLEVGPGMSSFEEELFGPVVSLIRARDEESAIQLANQSLYGLGAGVFSRDIERAEFIARDRLQAGNCFVNDFVKSDPRWPFGGIQDSGYGRELSEFGARSFANIKTVRVLE